jgi:hypothetical protein
LHDFVEAVDSAGAPWKDGNRILSDTGHALEFVGLAARFLLVLDRQPEKTPAQEDLLARCREELPAIFCQNFASGFNPEVGGICKAFDLVGRRPINTDMPWWSLPESLRAAAELLVLCPAAPQRDALLDAAARCTNGFFGRFVNPRVHNMAYQTVDAAGRPVDVIPATPDLDPGYHTGLSIIDYLDCLDRTH